MLSCCANLQPKNRFMFVEVLVPLAILLLAFFAWGVGEKNRLTPFYTPLQMTSLYLQVPISPALYQVLTSPAMAALPAEYQLLPTLLGFQTVADILTQVPVITVALNQSTGLPVIGAPWPGETPIPGMGLTLDQLMHAPAPGLGLPAGGHIMQPVSQEDFAAAGLLPVDMLFNNPNEFDVTIRNTSVGDVEAYDPVNNAFIKIGELKLLSDVKLGKQAKGVRFQIGMKMQIPGPLAVAINTAIAAGQTVPLFFGFTSLVTEVTVLFMFLPVTKHNLVKPKQCAVYLNRTTSEPFPGVLPGYRLDALYPSSATYCRDSKAEILAHMVSAEVAGAQASGTAIGPSVAMDESSPLLYVDSMDPPADTLDSEESFLVIVSSITVAFYCFVGVLCALLAFWCFFTGYKALRAGGKQQKTMFF